MTTRTQFLTENKPVKISLIGGKYRILTHAHKQIDLILRNPNPNRQNDIIPTITEYDNQVEIGGQTFKKMWGHEDKTEIDIFLPEKSEFSFEMRGGVVEVDGDFISLDVQLTTGEAILNPNSNLKRANISVGVGSIRFYTPELDRILYEKDGFWTKKFKYDERCDITLRMKIIGGFLIETKKTIDPKI